MRRSREFGFFEGISSVCSIVLIKAESALNAMRGKKRLRIRAGEDLAAAELDAVGFAFELGADGNDAIFDEAFDLVNGFAGRIAGGIVANGNIKTFQPVFGFSGDGRTDDGGELIDLREEAFFREEIFQRVFEFGFVDVPESGNGHGAIEKTEVVSVRFPDAGALAVAAAAVVAKFTPGMVVIPGDETEERRLGIEIHEEVLAVGEEAIVVRE